MTSPPHSSMSESAVAIIENYSPRCGIAPFAQNLRTALDQLGPDARKIPLAPAHPGDGRIEALRGVPMPACAID